MKLMDPWIKYGHHIAPSWHPSLFPAVPFSLPFLFPFLPFSSLLQLPLQAELPSAVSFPSPSSSSSFYHSFPLILFPFWSTCPFSSSSFHHHFLNFHHRQNHRCYPEESSWGVRSGFNQDETRNKKLKGLRIVGWVADRFISNNRFNPWIFVLLWTVLLKRMWVEETLVLTIHFPQWQASEDEEEETARFLFFGPSSMLSCLFLSIVQSSVSSLSSSQQRKSIKSWASMGKARCHMPIWKIELN